MSASDPDSGKENSLLASLAETVKTVVYALLIAGVFRTLFLQPFWIPSGSMKDTLLIGDFLFVNKMAYGYSRYSCPWALCPVPGRIWQGEPERGDVVVFRHINNTDYIKRVIGVPGDTVQVIDGAVYLNGAPLPQEPDGTFSEAFERQGQSGGFPRCSNGRSPSPGEMCEKSRFRETLPGGKSYSVLDIGTGSSDNTRRFEIPEGHYFFMGDNRDNSLDSRVGWASGGVDLVPADRLIGRAEWIMFSSAGSQMWHFWTWRGDRFFKGIE